MKNKTQKVIIAILLSNLLIANFAFAQAVTPPTPPTPPVPPTPSAVIPGLNTAGWNRAQSDQSYCLGEFKTSIQTNSHNDLKTVFVSDSLHILFNTQQCYVVLGAAPDPNPNSPSGAYLTALGTKWRPYGVSTLETAIKSSPQGISKQAIADTASQANTEQINAGTASYVVGWILDLLLGVVASFLGVITALAGAIFSNAVSQILIITSMPQIVISGWTVVRDICNMFFILAMIVIALGTILRLKNYQEYGHLLRDLVIMAILVNFSQVIAVTIMNAVNFVASVFYVNGLGAKVLSSLYSIANPATDTNLIINQGWQAGLTLGLGKILLMTVGAVVFIALAGMFVIRLVGLYVLIIFSPIAYVARILPSTEKFSEEWWGHFLKYLIWAPVALFLINLTILFTQNPNQIPGTDSSFHYFIITAFLAAALLVAEQAGMVGSKMIVNAVEKGAHSAFHYASHSADRKLASWSDSSSSVKRGLSYLSLGAAKMGYQQRMHHKEEEAYTVAAGKRANTITKVMSGGKETGDFERLARYQRVSQEKKRLENITDKDEIVAVAKHAYENKEYDKFMGAWSKLAAQGDYNEIPMALGKPASAAGIQEVVSKMAQQNKEYYRLAADVTKIAENQGDFIFAGAFERKADGNYGDRDEGKRREYVNTQRAKASDQSNIRNLNRRGLGFVEKVEEVNGQQVWYTDHIDEDGLDYASRMKNTNEWRNNGNKNAKASVVISASDKWLQVNPEAWAVAANEYAALEMDISPEGRQRLDEFRKSVAAPNRDRNYNTSSTVNRAQAKEFFELKMPEIKTKMESREEKDRDSVKEYKVLYEYAYGPTQMARPATTPTIPPPPTPTPPPGPTTNPIVQPPSNQPPTP